MMILKILFQGERALNRENYDEKKVIKIPKYKVKITRVKNFSPEDVFGTKFIRPSGKELKSCSFKEGQVYIVDDTGAMPEGFCQYAWCSILSKVNFIQFGGSYDDWAGEGVDYGVCPDGVRPAVFKIERV